MRAVRTCKEKAARDGYHHDRHGDAEIGGAVALDFAGYVLTGQE